MAITDVLADAETLFQEISRYLNSIVIALVIILFGFIIGKIVESILRKAFARIQLDERFAKLFGVRRNYARAIRRTIVRIIYLVTIIFALLSLNAMEEVFTILLVFVIIVVLASFVLAGVDVVPNLIARVSLRKKFAIGDEITFMHKSGVVQGAVIDITLTDVRIKRKNGDLFSIPNIVFQESIVKKRK